jgi:23S rRNA pseudouridine1911/1915/1917 synthase
MSGIFDVIYEDNGIVVVNKLAAVPVLPDRSGDQSLKEFILQLRPGKFIEPVHRIDRRTSGAVVFAKNRTILAALSAAFRERQIQKTYWAVTERAPDQRSGTFRHRIIHDKRRNQARAVSPEADSGDLAELAYELAACSDRYFLLTIQPLTGRTHQIRAQLAAVGLPIRGDLKYGARRSTRNGLIMLHAKAIRIQGDHGQDIAVEANPPPDDPLWAAFSYDPKLRTVAEPVIPHHRASG